MISQPSDLDHYMSLKEDELLEELGRQLIGGDSGFGSDDIERYYRYATRWWRSKLDEFRRIVCGDDKMKRFLDSGSPDKIAEAAVVFDAIRDSFGERSSGLIAVILVNNGLGQLCG
jgi:hypothetical protein